MNAGNLIGLLIAICLCLIVAAFIKLTWSFWVGMYHMAVGVPVS